MQSKVTKYMESMTADSIWIGEIRLVFIKEHWTFVLCQSSCKILGIKSNVSCWWMDQTRGEIGKMGWYL
jgi:hypothetical protein